MEHAIKKMFETFEKKAVCQTGNYVEQLLHCFEFHALSKVQRWEIQA